MPIKISELDEIPVMTLLIEKLESGKCYNIDELFEICYDKPISSAISSKGDTREKRWSSLLVSLSMHTIDITGLFTRLAFEFEKGTITQGTKDGITYFCKK